MHRGLNDNLESYQVCQDLINSPHNYLTMTTVWAGRGRAGVVRGSKAT
jgi:hypothetical protein